MTELKLKPLMIKRVVTELRKCGAVASSWEP